MWYEEAGVLILKLTVWPTSVLIWVAKPWIDSSPIPSICQLAGGSPGLEFSQATGLTIGAAQGLASAADAVGPPVLSSRRVPPTIVVNANSHREILEFGIQ